MRVLTPRHTFTPGHTVHLSLGGNLGDRMAALRGALRAIGDGGAEVIRVSPVYETPPMYLTGQPAFLNMAAVIRTPLGPRELLDALNAIEREAGRVRGGARNGPRPLDIDILTHGERMIREAALTIPHPGIAERPFVLVPLATIARDLTIPGLEGTVGALLAAVVGAEEVRRHAAPPTVGAPTGETYTIFLRDLTAPLPRLAPRSGGAEAPRSEGAEAPVARLSARLHARHPGRQFADDIGAVLSYEDVVVDFRRLCAEADDGDPEALALMAADLALTHPSVRGVEVEVTVSDPAAMGTGRKIDASDDDRRRDVAARASDRNARVILERS